MNDESADRDRRTQCCGSDDLTTNQHSQDTLLNTGAFSLGCHFCHARTPAEFGYLQHHQPYTEFVALRTYDTSIRPIEMGRKLLGVADAQMAEDTRSIPHTYTVLLHPDDHAAFADVERDLVRELAEALTQHTEREAYRLGAPAVVVLADNTDTKRGSFSIVPTLPTTPASATSSESAPVDAVAVVGSADTAEPVVVQPVMATMATPIASAITAALLFDDGSRHVLETERVTIGRHSGCTIAVRDTNVSREHAQLRRRPTGWTLRDLGSTNGTKLNGVRVEGEQMLATGDVIMLGAIKATFEIS